MSEKKEVETITIGDKVYLASSVTEKGAAIINNIKKIDGELSRLGLQVSISEYAKSRFMEDLHEEMQNFEELKPVPEAAK